MEDYESNYQEEDLRNNSLSNNINHEVKRVVKCPCCGSLIFNIEKVEKIRKFIGDYMKKCNYLSLGTTYINMDKVESIDINKAGLIINILFGHTTKELSFKNIESFNYNFEKLKTFIGMGAKD